MTDAIDAQTRQLAAMAYGEGSVSNDEDELYALASVLVRQRDARGYKDIGTFASNEKTFSFVVSDGNVRYQKLMKAKEDDIAKDAGMKLAVAAAKNALQGGVDKSNGAYFWDGADIKANYKNHFKVKNGIKFTKPEHNIYDIKESTKVVIQYKTIVKRIGNGPKAKKTVEKREVCRADHAYDSTAAYGGTIFWKMNPDYVKTVRGKEYM